MSTCDQLHVKNIMNAVYATSEPHGKLLSLKMLIRLVFSSFRYPSSVIEGVSLSSSASTVNILVSNKHN